MTTSTKRFVVPGVVFGVGILLIVAAALKVGLGLGPGVALCLLGLVLFGLSFIGRGRTADDPPPPMPFFQKLGNIFFEPSAVFRNLRAHPTWLGALLISSLLSFAYSTAFVQRLTPERIVNFTNDKVAERFNLPPEQMEQAKAQQIEENKSVPKVAGRAVTTFVFGFILSAVFAALYMLAVLLFGGRLGFWQALATFIWAALPVEIIRTVLSLILLYVKDPDDIHPVLGQGGLVTDNLGALVNSAEHPVYFAVLSFIGVLSFYRLWLTATGLRNASDKLGSSSAWTIALIFWFLALLLFAAFSALFGSLLS